MCALILLAQRNQFTIENFVIDMIRVMLYDDIILGMVQEPVALKKI